MPDEKNEQVTIPDNETPSVEIEMSQWLDELKEADPVRRAALDKVVLKKLPHLARVLERTAQKNTASETAAPAPEPAPTPVAAPPTDSSQEALYVMAPYMRPVGSRPQ